jgi:hypothetical protein
VSRSPLALINSLDKVDEKMVGRVVHLAHPDPLLGRLYAG